LGVLFCWARLGGLPNFPFLQKLCAELVVEQGKNAVFDFVKQNHRELSWYFCLECKSECPATSNQVCLVCGANIFDEDDPTI